MNYQVKSIFWISLLLLFHSNLCGQIFLQFEKANDPKALKYNIGDLFEFKLHEYPDTWRREIIQDIDPEQNLIILEDNFYNLSQFSHIRIRRKWATSLGNKLMQFSAAWYLYGAIATLAPNDYKMGESEIIIGGVFASIGFFIRTVFSKKKFKLNKNKRLRIMDLRMSID